MDKFFRELKSRCSKPGPAGRTWILVLEDQLSDEFGLLKRGDPEHLGIVLLESHWKASRRPYHKQKLAFQWLNLRHFALEQAERGVAVRYLTSSQPYRTTLKPLFRELGPLTVMDPAEWEVRQDLAPLFSRGLLTLIPHEGWLTSQDDFFEGTGKEPPWRLDAFYRSVRKKTGLLMKGERPLGGRYSFDTDNRQPWTGSPPAPPNLSFPNDPIKDEVIRLVDSTFRHHPGQLHPESLPGTQQDALRQWEWARTKCLPHFGRYEDAMDEGERGLFHTRISALVNIHRLLPRQVVQDVLALPLPLASKEGFIRQVLGWREFVHHVHRETRGFREQGPTSVTPGDAGYGRWANRKWKAPKPLQGLDGGARPSFLGAKASLPAAFWGTASGLHCLDQVVGTVWDEGYSHHITRLMVLSNIASLLDVSPRELTDWFWVAYLDAYDWVVEPNVLAMGTFGTGPLMTTKPYVSGSAYLDRMSNYCDHCAFHPKKNCPITHLYWAYLARHTSRLQTIPRLKLPLSTLKKRGLSKVQTDRNIFDTVRFLLREGTTLTPPLIESVLNLSGQTQKIE